jgi:ribosomal protein L11 methyltransferase
MLTALDLDHSCTIDVDEKSCRLLVLCSSREEATGTLSTITTALPGWSDLLTGTPPQASIIEIRQEDWSESWKEFFKPFRASKRLMVKPSWETIEDTPGDIIIDIDPGMCFGTGHHGTTKAVLQFLDELNEELGPVSFLDAGTGSGILSLAAAKLGYTNLTAFDHDPDAVRCAKENLANSGVTNVILSCEDIGTYSPPAPFRVVAANILAVVLMENAAHIATFVEEDASKPSYLILSGILTEQYPKIIEIYTALGFEEVRQVTMDEWTSGVFQKRKKRSE